MFLRTYILLIINVEIFKEMSGFQVIFDSNYSKKCNLIMDISFTDSLIYIAVKS